MNKLTIVGNLTKDPTVKRVAAGGDMVDVCEFTVAVNNRRDETAFFRCTAWRGLAGVIGKYAAKGKKVCVIGPVSAHAYTANNEARASLDVTVEDFEFCSARGEDKPAETMDIGNGVQATVVEDAGELPF